VAHRESVSRGALPRRTLVASNVRRVVDAAGGKPVLFFAARFDHWATQGGDGYGALVGGGEGGDGSAVLCVAGRFDSWATQGGDGYAAFVGGAEGVATDAQAAWWGERGLGTTPHALIATFGGDTVAAVRALATHLPDG